MRAGRGLRVGVAVLIGALSTVTVGVGPASAHVTVNPREATQGGYAKLAFRVPNEKATAATTKVEVFIPTTTPIASVSVRPVPGWTPAVERAKLATPLKLHDSEITEAVSKITWTATAGSEIKAGQFQEFEISAGPLPQVDSLVFKALQTYSDGEVVRWIEEPPAGGGAEPEHPAPVLKLTAAEDPTAGADPTADPTPDTDFADGAIDEADDDGTPWALTAGIAGLVAGLAGLVFGLLAWRRSRPVA